eukprot:365361-Chlamydomonas_euryale.AAC.12
MPARRCGYGQPNIYTRLADEDKSLFVTCRHCAAAASPVRGPAVKQRDGSLTAYDDAWAMRPAGKPGRPQTLLQLVHSGELEDSGEGRGAGGEWGSRMLDGSGTGGLGGGDPRTPRCTSLHARHAWPACPRCSACMSDMVHACMPDVRCPHARRV